jgi:predicted RNA-binding protein YlqC (UPF0109 family)
MSDQNNALEFVRYVLQQICKHPNDLSLEQIEDKRGTLIKIRSHEEDMGKIIGKSGQTISALRLLVKSMGAKINKKITLKVLDQDDNESGNETEE